MTGGSKTDRKIFLSALLRTVLLISAGMMSGCGARAEVAVTEDTVPEAVPETTETDLMVPDADPVNGGEIAVDVIAANDVGNLAGAAVRLEDADGTLIDERSADAMGGVVFAGVRAGNYTVTCGAEGYYGRSVTVVVRSRERSGRVVPLVPMVQGTEAYVLLEWRGEPQIDLDLCLFDAESGEYTDSAHSMDRDGNALYADRSFWDGYELLMIRDAQSSAERSVYVLDWVAAEKLLAPQPDRTETSGEPDAGIVPDAGAMGPEESGAGADGSVSVGAGDAEADGVVSPEAGGADAEVPDERCSHMEELELEVCIYTAEGEVCRISPDPAQDAALWRVATVRDGKATVVSEYITDLSGERWTLLEPEGQIRREAVIVPEWKEAYRRAVTEELPELCSAYGVEDYKDCVYYVLHIDGDEYPELVIEDPKIPEENTLILSYTGEGIVSLYKPGFGGWQYIPGSGKVLFGALTDGRMDYELISLSEGGFSSLKSGYTSSYETNGGQLTAYPEGQERCAWGGVPIIGYINFEETMKQDFDMSLTRDPDVLNETDYTRLAGYLDSGE